MPGHQHRPIILNLLDHLGLQASALMYLLKDLSVLRPLIATIKRTGVASRDSFVQNEPQVFDITQSYFEKGSKLSAQLKKFL